MNIKNSLKLSSFFVGVDWLGFGNDMVTTQLYYHKIKKKNSGQNSYQLQATQSPSNGSLKRRYLALIAYKQSVDTFHQT